MHQSPRIQRNDCVAQYTKKHDEWDRNSGSEGEKSKAHDRQKMSNYERGMKNEESDLTLCGMLKWVCQANRGAQDNSKPPLSVLWNKHKKINTLYFSLSNVASILFSRVN